MAQDSKNELWLLCFILNAKCASRQKQQTGGRKGRIEMCIQITRDVVIFHLICLVLHILPNSRVSKHSRIYSFAHCSRCMIRSQKTTNAINKTWSKVNYRLLFRVTLLLMVHYNDSFLTCGRDWQTFHNLFILLCNKCLLYTRKKINHKFQVE